MCGKTLCNFFTILVRNCGNITLFYTNVFSYERFIIYYYILELKVQCVRFQELYLQNISLLYNHLNILLFLLPFLSTDTVGTFPQSSPCSTAMFLQ